LEKLKEISELVLDHNITLQLCAAISYVIFGNNFDDSLASEIFSEEDINFIIEDKLKYKKISAPNNVSVTDRNFAFEHPGNALGRFLCEKHSEMKEVYINNIIGRKGFSVKNESIFLSMLESCAEKIDMSCIKP